eukprot:m.45740 g.45740  ORF g.45740 m.45740 type:complete len:55 (-) comp20045_c0_seq1:294-458(-)
MQSLSSKTRAMKISKHSVTMVLLSLCARTRVDDRLVCWDVPEMLTHFIVNTWNS